MSLLFTNALFWPLLALTVLPLLIHLFARARPPAFPFSSVVFIQRIVRAAQRIRRPRDWLLWLVRSALILLVALLFLKPLLFANRQLAAPHEPKTVIVIVDASASMAVQEGAQSRFVQACAEANDILAGLEETDRANLFWLRSAPDAVFPAPGVNIRYLREALRQATVSRESGNPGEALRTAMEMLRNEPGRKEIFIVSDFQQTNWQHKEWSIPADIHVATIRIGEELPGNLAITRIYTEPPHPLSGEPLTVFCEIRNFSPLARRTPVFLHFRELRERQEIALAPWERTTVLFAIGGAEAGVYPLGIQIAEDEFPGDNSRHAIIQVRPALRIGILRDDAETAEVWRRALEASGHMETFWTSPDGSDANPPDALLLAGWDGSASDAVRDYLQAGGLVVWAPAPGTPPDRLHALTGPPHAFPASRPWNWQTAPGGTTFRLRMGKRDDPAFAVFEGGQFGDPTLGIFHGRLDIPPPAAGAADTLLWYQDETPALAVLRAGAGRLILWNLPLHQEAGDWAGRMEFLPLLCELVMVNRSRLMEGASRHESSPGLPLGYRPEMDTLAEDVRLQTPAGEFLPVTREETVDGPVFLTEAVSETGIYAWHLHTQTVFYSAVNFPPEESDLRATDMDMATETWTGLASGREAQALRAGVPVWPYCLALILLLAVFEAALLLEARRPA